MKTEGEKTAAFCSILSYPRREDKKKAARETVGRKERSTGTSEQARLFAQAVGADSPDQADQQDGQQGQPAEVQGGHEQLVEKVQIGIHAADWIPLDEVE